jgi:hypothetical protein
LLEQFGGANGQLAVATPYLIQGLNWDELTWKDLLVQVGSEEIVGPLCTAPSLRPLKLISRGLRSIPHRRHGNQEVNSGLAPTEKLQRQGEAE